MKARLIVVALGLTPFLLLEIALHLLGYSSDPAPFCGPDHPFFTRSGGMIELAPERHRQLRTEPFPVQKPPGTIRIIVIGDSTVFGYTWLGNVDEDGDLIVLPEPFPALLERALEERCSEPPFEVVNGGACSCATYRLKTAIHEVLSFSPDVVVFMAGSSDFLESRMLRNWRRTHPLTTGLLRRWKTLCLARDLLRRFSATSIRRDDLDSTASMDADPQGPGLALLGSDVVRNRGEAEELLTESVSNLEEIVRMCRERGVPLVLCTVPSNLRIPPSIPAGDELIVENAFLEGVPEETRVRFNRTVARITALVEQGESRRALLRLEEAFEDFPDDPRVSALHFLEGRCHDSLRDWKQARQAYRAAKDRDPFIWRVLSGFNETVRRLSCRDGVLLADIEQVFTREMPDGIPDDRLLFDYCHFRPRGHALVTAELVKVLERGGLLKSR